MYSLVLMLFCLFCLTVILACVGDGTSYWFLRVRYIVCWRWCIKFLEMYGAFDIMLAVLNWPWQKYSHQRNWQTSWDRTSLPQESCISDFCHHTTDGFCFYSPLGKNVSIPWARCTKFPPIVQGKRAFASHLPPGPLSGYLATSALIGSRKIMVLLIV